MECVNNIYITLTIYLQLQIPLEGEKTIICLDFNFEISKLYRIKGLPQISD